MHISKKMKFKNGGAMYYITKIAKNRVYFRLFDDVVCLDDTGGILPPMKGSCSIKEFDEYKKENPACFDMEE